MPVTNYPLITGVGSTGGATEQRVESYADVASFPVTGEAGVVYIDEENADLYLWDGSVYELQGGGDTAVETHFFSRIPKFPESLNYYLIDMDHFTANPNPYVLVTTGSGQAAPLPYDVPGAGATTTIKAVGLFGLAGGTGTDFAGLSVHLANGNYGSMYLGAHAMRMGIRANMGGSVPVTDDVEITYFGLWSHFTGEPAEMVCFRHEPDVNGGRWEAVAKRNDPAGETKVDTGVAPTANVYQNLEIEINRAGTEAKYYIDGSLVATITTTLPTLSILASGALRRKTSGSTFRRFIIDAIYHANEKLSARG